MSDLQRFRYQTLSDNEDLIFNERRSTSYINYCFDVIKNDCARIEYYWK